MGRIHHPLCASAHRFGGSALLAIALSSLNAATAPAQPSPNQGVMAHELVIGTHLDLSGPLAPWGESVRNGLEMAIGEANSDGGINGRRIRLVVQDDGYDPERANRAVRDLVAKDRVFAVLSPLGTPTAQAAMRQALSRGVLYLFPLTATEDTYLPIEPLKFGVTPSHALAVEAGLRRILNARGPMRVGMLASNDEFGRAVKKGVEEELERRGLEVSASETFGRGAPDDLTAAVARLKAKRIEVVVLGTEAREAIAALQAASATNWRPMFLCSSACYLPEVATLGGAVAEGLYAVGQLPIPGPNDPRLSKWVNRYEATYSKVATLQALTAYRNARLFLTVLRQLGPNPTQAGFARALETRGAWTDPVLGGLPIEFSQTDHLGSHSSLLAQIRGGHWTILADNLPKRP